MSVLGTVGTVTGVGVVVDCVSGMLVVIVTCSPCAVPVAEVTGTPVERMELVGA